MIIKVMSLFLGLIAPFALSAQCDPVERKALIEFYFAMDGPNWRSEFRWDTTKPCDKWPGVVTRNGRVTGIDLDGDPQNTVSGIDGCTHNPTPGIKGTFPPQFFQTLPNLEALILPRGAIASGFPDLSKTKIKIINMSCCAINGTLNASYLPSTIEELYLDSSNISSPLPPLNSYLNLRRVNLSSNAFTGAVPDLLSPIKCNSLLLTSNNLKGIIPAYREQQGINLYFSGNAFTFENLLPNFEEIKKLKHNLVFMPQQAIGPAIGAITVALGGDLVWDLGIDKGLTSNIYTWSNGIYTVQTSTSKLVWEVPDNKAEGTWICKVTNTLLPNTMFLDSHPFQVTLCQPDVENIDTALCPGQTLTVRGTLFDRNKPTGKIEVKGAAKNGCDSIYRVKLRYPETLDAGPDTLLCSEPLALRARLPQGFSGTWIADPPSVDLLDPTQPRTTAENFVEGTNRFIWKVTSPACPLGDADTVRVSYDKPPTAVDLKTATFTNKPLIGDSELVKKGIFDPANDVLENLPDQSGKGEFVWSLLPGSFDYNPGDFFGTFNLPYRVCSKICPKIFCDTALVKIAVEPERQPQVVTPNGDGKNDVLVIKELAADPDAFPESELIIFNANGSLLFSQKNYKNDWPNGQTPPPTGTYWYQMGIAPDRKTVGGRLLLIN